MNIYLDNHTSTKPCRAVLEFLLEKEQVLSPHAPHNLGSRAFALLEEAVSSLFFRKGKETYFFSSWQEVMDRLFFALYFNEISETGKNQILVLQTEDAPILYAAEKLKNLGCEIKTIGLDKKGNVDLKAFEDAINSKTAFFSLSYANGLTGVIHPIDKIQKICTKHQIKLHVDFSYVLGKVFVDFSSLPIDFMTFSSHLFHGTASTCLVCKRKDFFTQNEITKIPLWTQDPHLAKSFSLAVKQAELFADKMGLEVVRLKKEFEKRVLSEIEGAVVLFQDIPTLPNVSVIYFPKVHSEALLYRLNKRGVFATFGGGASQPLFTVLEHTGVDPLFHQACLSFALSRYTTKEEIEKASSIIIEEIKALQMISKDL